MSGRKRRQREEPCHICNHFHDYEGGEPCATCGHRLASSTAMAAALAAAAGGGGFEGGGGGGEGGSDFAAEDAMPRASARPGEIDAGIFFGSYDNAARNEVLRALQITHILNTVPTCNELYKTSYTYFTTPAIPPDLRACCEFIARARSGLPGGGNVVGGLGSDVGGLAQYPPLPGNSNNQSEQPPPPPPPPPGRVLIHDMTGNTRAPLVAAAWLVAAHGASPQGALAAVAARRPGVAPKAADVSALEEFVRELRSSPGGGAEFAAAGRRQQQLQMGQQRPGGMVMGQQQWQQQ